MASPASDPGATESGAETGMGTARLEAFSDGVIAVIITIFGARPAGSQ